MNTLILFPGDRGKLAAERARQADALARAKKEHKATVPILGRMARITTALLAAEVKTAKPRKPPRAKRRPADPDPTLFGA